MAFRINHNIASMNAYRNLIGNDRGLSKSLERLSSGLKINKSADDPAGLVVSENMRAQIQGLGQAIENSELATSMVQTAEGALTEVHALLLSMRELAIHAANEGANSAADLAADQAEIDNALSTIDRIGLQTQFGTKRLLDGSQGVRGSMSATSSATYVGGTAATTSGTYDITVTAQAEKAHIDGTAGAAITLTAAEDLVLTNNTSGVAVTVNLLIGDDQQTILDKINAHTDTTGIVAVADGNNIDLDSDIYGTAADIAVTSSAFANDGSRSGLGAGGGQQDEGVDVDGTFTSAIGTVYQADGVGATLTGRTGSAVEGLSILTYAAAGADGAVTITNNAMVFQVGANAGQTVSLAIDQVSASYMGTGIGTGTGGTNQFNSLADISILDAARATDSLGVIDKAISDMSSLRGTLGAFQSNTLESGINNMRVAEENLVAAESIIRDTDMAAEMATFTRNQIMLQAATAMLSHANTTPQAVLQLLSG
ncbi:MAG: flagellin [bacterium]|nr:flagellin [bacterium]